MRRILKQLQYLSVFVCLPLISMPALADRAVQSGHWAIVGEEGLGSGININIQNDRVGLTIFSYDQNGDAIWYLGTGELREGNSIITARLFTAREGQALDTSFEPAEQVDTGQDIRIVFTGTVTGEFTLNGTTKAIRLLQFAGDTVTIPGNPDPGTVATIPDISGEWMFVLRQPDQATQTRFLNFAPMSTFPAVGQEIPDAPIIYVHEDNPLSRAFFYCDVTVFDGLNARLPTCTLRFVDNERITEYDIPTENISPDRFDAGIVSIPEVEPPQVFAVRLDN